MVAVRSMGRLIAATLTLTALLSAATLAAAPYPDNVVRLICWSSAGAPLDVMMRQLGKQLGEQLHQTFVVENRPGGEGVVAMSALMNRPADGYSILSTTSSFSFTLATGRIAYTPSDFIVLPALQAEPSAIAVRADSRFKTMKQLIDFLREQPDKLSVGGFSSAGFHQYVFHRLQQDAHFNAVWVPFKGGQEAALALLGGHIDVTVMTPSSALAQIRNGDIRLLGISSAARNEYFPDVPTFREQGYDVVEEIWRGVMMKRGTPQPIVDALSSTITTIKQTDEWRAFSRLNLQSQVDVSLDQMQQKVRDEITADRAFLEHSGLLK
jgi:tripartite-type tricarboxylate transporter receptor subunit TctC